MTILISDIQDLMLNKDNINHYSRFIRKTDLNTHQKTDLNTHQNKKKSYIVTPSQKDTLFWCFYIIHYGLVKYEMVYNFFTEEKKEKIACVEFIRIKKNVLKKNKWKRTQIENELVNEKSISLKTFLCLLTIFDYSYVVIENRKVYKNIIHDVQEKTHLILKNGEEYSLYTEKDKISKINNAINNFYIIENINKLLKGISSYRIKELRNICTKLNLPYEKKKKKELYQLLMEHL